MSYKKWSVSRTLLILELCTVSLYREEKEPENTHMYTFTHRCVHIYTKDWILLAIKWRLGWTLHVEMNIKKAKSNINKSLVGILS